ncbi:hypothetical protein ACT6NV_00020 [Robiginitalea sp. IMCC44478]|uniref:hypothetical protein n=1 Tax=Robiginitalea sp. IMCC44478 TaxID=3459122 RepID=UPI0040423044
MKRWISFFGPLVMIFFLASFGLKSYENREVKVPESLKMTIPTSVHYPTPREEQQNHQISPPFLGASLTGFREALAFKESSGNYFSINTLGYLGKYQFGIGTLQLMGVYNATKFLKNPALQEKVFTTNLARNKWILRKDIPRFTGKRINGVEITESGILAAAHLAGPGNVKKYLRSNGSREVLDAYGTSITHYLKRFKGYDTSGVPPIKNPKVD